MASANLGFQQMVDWLWSQILRGAYLDLPKREWAAWVYRDAGHACSRTSRGGLLKRRSTSPLFPPKMVLLGNFDIPEYLSYISKGLRL